VVRPEYDDSKESVGSFKYIFVFKGVFYKYCIQYCFICCALDSTVSEDAGIEPRSVATMALAFKRSNNPTLYTYVFTFHSTKISPRSQNSTE
jgi:hypothetical protein